MEVTISNFMSIGLLFLFHALVAGALVFETDDAIVVKGRIHTNYLKTNLHVSQPKTRFYFTWLTFTVWRQNFVFNNYCLVSIDAADKNYLSEENVGLARKSKSDEQKSEMVDSDDRSCLTFDRHVGVCLPISECYPYTKMHKTIDNLESWVIGTRGTCNYVEPSGKQVKKSSL
jgi:hypothetical protein